MSVQPLNLSTLPPSEKPVVFNSVPSHKHAAELRVCETRTNTQHNNTRLHNTKVVAVWWYSKTAGSLLSGRVRGVAEDTDKARGFEFGIKAQAV